MQPLKILTYGEPGVGKTTLLASGLDDERLVPGLIFDFEGGTLSIASKIRYVTLEDFRNDKGFVPSPLDCLRVTAWDDFATVRTLLQHGRLPYRFLGIDSLSEINYLALQEVSGAGEFETPDLQDYLKTSTALKSLVRAFRDLPQHLVFVCGTQTKTNPRTRLDHKLPNLVGKLAYEVCGLVDIVGLLETYTEQVRDDAGNTEDVMHRELITYPSDHWVAKDRTEGGLLGGSMQDPTLTAILNLIEPPKAEPLKAEATKKGK
ncbi:MAG TPA: AAA family ATPase [Bacillota bacterium]|nr:AAA family ATPase [Dermatophilaceae bacterium]HOI35790.1 AAA family ATPase [Bacillota bacterium]